MTNRAHYYVVYDGEWKIQCDGENSEPIRAGAMRSETPWRWPTSMSATGARRM